MVCSRLFSVQSCLFLDFLFSCCLFLWIFKIINILLLFMSDLHMQRCVSEKHCVCLFALHPTSGARHGQSLSTAPGVYVYVYAIERHISMLP